MRQIAKVKGGKRLPKGFTLTNKPTSHPYIRVTDLRENSVRLGNILYVPNEAQAYISRYTITASDVYVSIAGSIGLVGMVPKELDGANLTENAARLVICNELAPEFLMRFLSHTSGQSQIQTFATKNAQPKLALTRIEDIVVPVPQDLQEQLEVVDALATIDRTLAHHQKKRAALNDLFQTLLHKLMSAEIRVADWDIDTSEISP